MDDNTFRAQVARVKDAYDIVDYVDSHGVSLSPSGTAYKGLCPFHNDKTPSLVVDPVRQSYHCFGCGASGDIISYVCETGAMGFAEALTMLGAAKNIDVHFTGDTSEQGDPRERQRIRDAVAEADRFFISQFKSLPDNHYAVAEVTRRGLSRTMWRFGYAPPGGHALLDHMVHHGFDEALLEKAGLVYRSSRSGRCHDFWADRLMFTLCDTAGRPVAFSGRRLNDRDVMRGKYVNSHATPIFDKSSTLFNLENARKPARNTSTIVVCEGQFDVVAVSAAGIPAVVASSGTAFSAQQGNMCRRIVGDDGRIIICFDGDEAGRKAAMRLFTAAPSLHRQACVVSLPDGADPCDFRGGHGDTALRTAIMENSIPLPTYVISVLTNSHDMNSDAGRTHFVHAAAELVATTEDAAIAETMIARIARLSAHRLSVVSRTVDEARRTMSRHNYSPSHVASHVLGGHTVTVGDDSREEHICERLDMAGTPESWAGRMFYLCVMAGTPAPVSAIVNSSLLHDVIPAVFRPLFTTLHILRESGDDRIIAEKFSTPHIASHILVDMTLFPMVPRFDDVTVHTLLRTCAMNIAAYRRDRAVQRVQRRAATLLEQHMSHAEPYTHTMAEIVTAKKKKLADVDARHDDTCAQIRQAFPVYRTSTGAMTSVRYDAAS